MSLNLNHKRPAIKTEDGFDLKCFTPLASTNPIKFQETLKSTQGPGYRNFGIMRFGRFLRFIRLYRVEGFNRHGTRNGSNGAKKDRN